jgi:hypothetical protein
MRLTFRLLTLAASVTSLPVITLAQAPLSGIELYHWCTSENAEIQSGCLTFLTGFIYGYGVGQQMAQLPGNRLLCLPSNLTAEQLQLIVLKGMREHPEMLNDVASLVVTRSFSDVYRCKPNETPAYGANPK